MNRRHVTWLGMRSRSDRTIVRRAIDEGFVLVTNDALDFTALYRREAIHPGLVCLNIAPTLMSLGTQKSLFLLALQQLGQAEPVNEVLDITAEAGGALRVEKYSLP